MLGKTPWARTLSAHVGIIAAFWCAGVVFFLAGDECVKPGVSRSCWCCSFREAGEGGRDHLARVLTPERLGEVLFEASVGTISCAREANQAFAYVDAEAKSSSIAGRSQVSPTWGHRGTAITQAQEIKKRIALWAAAVWLHSNPRICR